MTGLPTKIAHNIFVYQSNFWQTNSIVIVDEAAVIVIDPCYFPVEIRVIADFVNRKKSFNKYILFTHSDFDHIIGYQFFKNVKLVGHSGIALCDVKSQIAQLREVDLANKVIRNPDFCFPALDVTFSVEHTVNMRDDNLFLFHAPGHTYDSVFTVSEKNRTLFAGDYLSDIDFPFICFSAENYAETLLMAEKLINQFEIEYLIPGHGAVEAGKNKILDRVFWDQEYIAGLSRQIREMLNNGFEEAEIINRLQDFKYKSRLIEKDLLPFHDNNIHMIIKEISYDN